MTNSQLAREHHHKLFPGILLGLANGYEADATLVKQMVEANRRAGLAGEVYFYNESVRKILPLMRELYVPVQ